MIFLEIFHKALFYHKTFGFWMCIDTWYANGLPKDVDLNEFFMFDTRAYQVNW